ncbi:hypothetical protein OQA88_4126 [Cercophora sp. LCS_1]
MPNIFSRFRNRDGKKKGQNLADQLPVKEVWEDAWARKSVEPEEIQELIKLSSEELKARALDLPFLLLPFRPTSDPSAVRTFVRHFFGRDGSQTLRGEALARELRMTEPMVISGVVKWCWSRLQGGVVGWDSYELFKVGEHDSNMARDSFKTFIPLSVESEARGAIIFSFFDLLSAIAAHGKMNGFGGRKLSRMAAWWAFEIKDDGNGFEGGYKAADATSHLFFAYLRSLAPQPSRGGISLLPTSLLKLLQETEYPPQRPALMQSSTNRVAMIVDTVSPTPFALLRRANHFQYREQDRALREYAEYEDPVSALTEECRRVLRAISAANQSKAVSSSKHSTSLRDASWSRFEDIGFASALEEEDEDDSSIGAARRQQGLRSTPASGNLGRPTTPSWADFLSSGFVDEKGGNNSNMLLPPDKVLPPIETAVRQRSSQSHRPRLESESHQLEPGELASIIRFDLDDAFWWVWISSLGPEETAERKAAFGRCAVIETIIRTGRWLVMEEIVKGAAPDIEDGAYIAEKKSFFSWTRRGKGISRRKSTGKHALDRGDSLKNSSTMGFSKTSIGPDQQAKIQAAAQQLQLQERQKAQQQQYLERRGRNDSELMAEKTNSVLTLQPSILSEASPAVKWANKYDKEAIREAYLANTNAGRGSSVNLHTNGHATPTTNGYDHPPELPPKSATTLPQSPSYAPRAETPEPKAPLPAEESFEVPRDTHPAERPSDVGRSTPLPPPKEVESMELARESMASPEPDLSPESKKQKKLQKEMSKTAASGAATGGGLRKLFARKNRQSKLPENAARDLNSMTTANEKVVAPVLEPTPAPSRPSVTEAAPIQPEPIQERPEPISPPSPPSVPVAPQVPVAPVAPVAPIVPVAPVDPGTPPVPEPTYEPDLHDNKAPAAPAKSDFSRFNQGPLLEQPAFVPGDEGDDVDDAVPPPIARHSSRSPLPSPRAPPPARDAGDDEAASPPPPVARKVDPQDRWAQIRKNAAERAAQRQPGPEERKPLDLDDDASSEETIESRVARIKARVAELTNNAEGSRAPPPIRR